MQDLNNDNRPEQVITPEKSHFRLVKPSVVLDNHSTLSYITHTAVALVVGISVMSFLTQGVLALKDLAFSGSSSVSENDPSTLNSTGSVGVNGSVDKNGSKNSGLGSDDGESSENGSLRLANASSTGQYGDGNEYNLADGANFPKPTARAFLAADLETGEIILEQNENLIAPMASVSKLMTAVVAKENLDMQKLAIVSRDSYNTYGSEGELLLGEKIKVYDLMYPLLMESSNDAAEVLADAYDRGHNAFMALMNKKAVELGMNDTYYEDPSGLNPKNVSSIHDLLKLGRYVYQKHPEIYSMTRVRQYSILKHTWFNKNRFLTYDNFLGGKNGYIDESKKTTVSLFDVTMARGGKRPVVVVLLKSDDREGDALKVINFLKKNAYYQEASTEVGADKSLE